MIDQQPPRDDDPSGMTDFEKNTTQGELDLIVDEAHEAPIRERQRQERHNSSPDEESGRAAPANRRSFLP